MLMRVSGMTQEGEGEGAEEEEDDEFSFQNTAQVFEQQCKLYVED